MCKQMSISEHFYNRQEREGGGGPKASCNVNRMRKAYYLHSITYLGASSSSSLFTLSVYNDIAQSTISLQICLFCAIFSCSFTSIETTIFVVFY